MAQAQVSRGCISCGDDLPTTDLLPQLCSCDSYRTTCNVCMTLTVNGQIDDNEWANIECEGGCGDPLDPHEIPWHDGLTCTKYDTVVANYANSRENRLSEAEIENIARFCPDCGAPIKKDEGHQCYEIECPSCRNIFCWECLENIESGTHDPTCSHHASMMPECNHYCERYHSGKSSPSKPTQITGTNTSEQQTTYPMTYQTVSTLIFSLENRLQDLSNTKLAKSKAEDKHISVGFEIEKPSSTGRDKRVSYEMVSYNTYTTWATEWPPSRRGDEVLLV
ncbi:putative ring finger protein [Venturia nashicola]|uniref:Putative ring finger protein n=1 Tax=Venturia nashicola TaxID=86259 RepID=A0A4Z1P7B7_9PEZI|nr:putative ring finger protein [Venturia nashicola]